jgi:ribonuclease HI
VIRDPFGSLVGSVSAYLGTRTNNYAEYEAVIRALETLATLVPGEKKEAQVAVKMDSELVVKQMNGVYKVKHPTLKDQQARLLRAMEPFSTVTFTHVYREENTDADALANAAMDRGA